MAEEQPNTICEGRVERMVSRKDGKSRVRIARFLKPCVKSVNQAAGVPDIPLLSEIFSHSLQEWPSKVVFRGWKPPQKKWKEWIDRLALKHGATWNQTGICDAIMSSTYEIRCDRDLVLGLSEFWCSETNTFVFPWGEATLTLEDMMILGGFPVLGEPVTGPLTGELSKIVEGLEKERKEMFRTKAKKATYSAWMEHFMEEQNDLEHAGFLALWLSRYVFPPLPEDTIGKHVFPMAAHLSRGRPMALAPAVLASLYRDLSILREQAITSAETIIVSAPFQILQLWAFERFPLLGPRSPHSLEPGEPRAARWHKLNTNINLPLVRSAVRLPENFRWRPYAANLKIWRHLSYYKETEQFMVDCSSLDDELRSFVGCLRVSELVGIDCVEKYMPHRVGMQFGMDQELPGDFDYSGFKFTWEKVGFLIPPRSFQPDVSVRYYNWWKDCMSTRRAAIKNILKKRSMKNSKSSLPHQARMNKEGCHASVRSGSSKNPTRLLQASTKSVGEGRPKFAPKIKTEPRNDGSDKANRIPTASVARKTNREWKVIRSFPSKMSKGSCHASDTPKFAPNSDDLDHIPIAARVKLLTYTTNRTSSSQKFLPCNRPRNHESVSLSSVNETSRKRELSATAKWTSQDEATIRLVNGISREVERKSCDSAIPNGNWKRVKREAGVNLPMTPQILLN